MLSFVVDVNGLIAIGALSPRFTYKELKTVRFTGGDESYDILQDKYAAMVKYVQMARRFGLLGYDGKERFDPFSSDSLTIGALAVGSNRQVLLAALTADEHVELITEANATRLRRMLQSRTDAHDDTEEASLRTNVHALLECFLSAKSDAIKAAMASM